LFGPRLELGHVLRLPLAFFLRGQLGSFGGGALDVGPNLRVLVHALAVVVVRDDRAPVAARLTAAAHPRAPAVDVVGFAAQHEHTRVGSEARLAVDHEQAAARAEQTDECEQNEGYARAPRVDTIRHALL